MLRLSFVNSPNRRRKLEAATEEMLAAEELSLWFGAYKAEKGGQFYFTPSKLILAGTDVVLDACVAAFRWLVMLFWNDYHVHTHINHCEIGRSYCRLP